MNGVIVIKKEKEFTSFDVVAIVRRTLHTKKVGHCGTLDPNATGVLPVLIGNATKAQDIIPNHDKSYVADFRLGYSSDTLDVWGEVKKESNTAVTEAQLKSVAENFVGDIMQTPPMYSAVQKDGIRLYELARKGIEIEREARAITIYSLEILSFDSEKQEGKLAVSCSKGTYIRQLIADIAEKLGTSAIMTDLVRTSACGFELEDAITLEQLKVLCENDDVEKHTKSLESLFVAYDELRVSDKQAHRFKNGNPLDITRTALRDINVTDGTIYRVKSMQDDFLALGVVDLSKGVIKIFKHFGN